MFTVVLLETVDKETTGMRGQKQDDLPPTRISKSDYHWLPAEIQTYNVRSCFGNCLCQLHAKIFAELVQKLK